MQWVFILLAVLFHVMYVISSSSVSTRIQALSGALLTEIVSVIVLVFFIIIQYRGSTIDSFKTLVGGITQLDLILLILAGIGIAGLSFAILKSFDISQGAGYIVPLVYGSSIVFTYLYNTFFSHKLTSPVEIAGVIIVITGLGCIGLARL